MAPGLASADAASVGKYFRLLLYWLDVERLNEQNGDDSSFPDFSRWEMVSIGKEGDLFAEMDIGLSRFKVNDFPFPIEGKLNQKWRFKQPGDYISQEYAGFPYFIIWDKQSDKFRAFNNVCRHRGYPVISKPEGNCSGVIACFYHSWVSFLRLPYQSKDELAGPTDKMGR